MKTKNKIITSTVSVLIATGLTYYFHQHGISNNVLEVLGQLNNGVDLTKKISNSAEYTVLVWLVCVIMNSMVWFRKEKKAPVSKIDFDFTYTEKEKYHE